jgi:large subunit ribosomal protein L19
MDIIKGIEEGYLKKGLPDFRVGDKIIVEEKIIEQDKTRTQAFEGVVIAKKGGSVSETFTVRKISHGEGVERIFSLHSPLIKEIKIHRAKLYYLREKVGKKAKVKIEEREGVKEASEVDNVSLGTEDKGTQTG